MNKSLLVKCPKCGAEPGHRCHMRGFELSRTHKQRLFQAENELNGGRVFTATDNAALPQRVKCPSCGAAPGEQCMRISQTAQNEAGWEYCAPQPHVRKHRYCSSRWAVVAGRADFDVEESAAETGLWAGDAESTVDTGLLAEVPDDNEPGEVGMHALSTAERVAQCIAANRAKAAEEQARRRKVLNWGGPEGAA